MIASAVLGREFVIEPVRRPEAETGAGAAAGADQPREWVDTFPVIEVRRDVVIINADPAGPPQRWAILREQITGAAVLKVGDWTRLRPEHAATATGDDMPLSHLSPSSRRFHYAITWTSLAGLAAVPFVWWFLGMLGGITMLVLAIAALAASAALTIADGR